jgi:hypothetical protein
VWGCGGIAPRNLNLDARRRLEGSRLVAQLRAMRTAESCRTPDSERPRKMGQFMAQQSQVTYAIILPSPGGRPGKRSSAGSRGAGCRQASVGHSVLLDVSV